MTVEVVPWEDPAVAALRTEQQAELAARYGSQGDLVQVLPTEEMLVTVLVRVDGEPAGCGSVRDASGYGPGCGELKRMYVRPDLRGRGLSRLVLTRLEAEAVRRGVRRLVLETGVRQPESIGLYRSAGYTSIPRYGPYVDDEESVCFERSLV
ncbi:GCN5 family acetyltransferase [Cellulomonas bogoriensis 69B4 = DSM 16987]|uniref:GCN5 family acetyltransferase n=1 Tax=Cellulomonas bogoriensis 69B4 = DSM 16987 TaxID=1386082 RepID=A0A0A0BPA8_9CELL|nr:GCN5 family acetyltransferase [Cellulomonas bogoriensis 69B4 = DSM 16987]